MMDPGLRPAGMTAWQGGQLSAPTILMFLFLLVPAAQAAVSGLYISQAGGGSGATCASTKDVTFFNTAANWGTSAGQIGPGTTTHLCGTITTNLTAQASGTAGNPITILFEPGAKISTGACGSTSCINIAGKSYIIVDGGTNGIIEATNNGTGLGNGDSNGVYFRGGSTHLEIKNLSINNMYVHTGASDNAGGNYYALWGDGTNNLIHDNTINQALAGIKIEAPSSGNSYYANVMHNINWGIFESGSNNPNSITNEKIYGNEIYDFANWDTTADTFHHDGIFLSGNSATTDLTHVDVYNNYLHGTSASPVTCAPAPGNGSCMTAYIYINTDSNVRVFNNLLVANSGDPGPNNGWILMFADNQDSLFNNTVIGGTTTGNSNCVVLNSGTNFVFENNLLSNCSTLLWAKGATFTTFNFNVYQNSSLTGAWRNGSTWYDTLDAWRTAINGDANAQATTGSLNLDFNYKPQSNSIAVGAGANLTSLNIPALDSDKAGAARPASGPWDVGAYQSAGSAGGPVVNVYIAQSPAGAADGSSCANAKDVSFFNTAANWGASAGLIGPGTTVHLCGTFTGADAITFLTFQGSGTSDYPVTLLFETGAALKPNYCADAGCIDLNGQSNIVIDGGVTCGETSKWAATACNGNRESAGGDHRADVPWRSVRFARPFDV